MEKWRCGSVLMPTMIISILPHPCFCTEGKLFWQGVELERAAKLLKEKTYMGHDSKKYQEKKNP